MYDIVTYFIFILVIVFLVGIVKGSIKTLRIYGRGKNAAAFFLSFFMLLTVLLIAPPEKDSTYNVSEKQKDTFDKAKDTFEIKENELAEEVLKEVLSGDPSYRENDEKEELTTEQKTKKVIAEAVSAAEEKLLKNEFTAAREDLYVALRIDPTHQEARQLESLINQKEEQYLEEKELEEMARFKEESVIYAYRSLIVQNEDLIDKKIKLNGRLTEIGNTHSDMFALLSLLGTEGGAVMIQYPMEYHSFTEKTQVTIWGTVSGMREFRRTTGEIENYPLISVKYMD